MNVHGEGPTTVKISEIGWGPWSTLQLEGFTSINMKQQFFKSCNERLGLADRLIDEDERLRRKEVYQSEETLSLSNSSNSYVEMIDWKRERITEPPMTMMFSTKQLVNSLKTKKILPFVDIPNNTQGVERMVKMVTEVKN